MYIERDSRPQAPGRVDSVSHAEYLACCLNVLTTFLVSLVHRITSECSLYSTIGYETDTNSFVCITVLCRLHTYKRNLINLSLMYQIFTVQSVMCR